jgi:hypothetical protein
MLKLLTPARVTAAVGVLTGLGAAASALAGALPTGGVSSAVVAAAGLLVQATSIFKFLEGQSAWETHVTPPALPVARVLADPVPTEQALPDVAVLPEDDPAVGVDPAVEPERLAPPEPPPEPVA